MPINFHSESNRYTYASRSADSSWENAIASLVHPQGKTVLDVGCGGGIYARAWGDAGAGRVIGVDFSEVMARSASEAARHIPNIAIAVGSALAVPLTSVAADIVFERALIHHIADDDLPQCVSEARRILKPGGVYLIQDRTPEDVSLPGSPEHIRGYLFEAFPRLIEIEKMRRRRASVVTDYLHRAGFTDVDTLSFWEARRSYASFDDLAEDIRGRVGRSILHELSDDELDALVAYIRSHLSNSSEIIEKDRWTIWTARKPA